MTNERNTINVYCTVNLYINLSWRKSNILRKK